MAALDTLVQEGVLKILQKSVTRYGQKILESIPTPQQVSDFITELQQQTHPERIFNLLHYSERDHTVVLTHEVQSPPQSVVTQYPGKKIIVRLSTVTQDYTDRSTAYWKANEPTGWPISACHDVLQPQHLQVIQPMFSPAQRFLLTYRNRQSYLHILRRDELTENGMPCVVYSVETAPRLATETNVNMPSLQSLVSHWPGQKDFTRRYCNPEEVTLWAVLHLVPPLPQHDDERLAVIREAIYAVVHHLHSPPVSPTPTPRPIPAGFSLFHMLTIRYAAFRDGRARYALVVGALKCKSLAPYGRSPRMIVSPNPVQQQNDELRTTQNNVCWIVLVGFLGVLTASLGLIYLIRLAYVKNDGVDDVVGAAVGIFMGLMLPALTFWVWICYGSSRSDWAHRRIQRKVRNIVADAERLNDPSLRVKAVTCNEARSYFNDDRLTFTGYKYSGHRTYDEDMTFDISQLIHAGFITTFALDGREVLVTPHKTWVRLKALDSDGRAVFESESIFPVNAERIESEDFGRRVIPETNGLWTDDLVVGSKSKLGEALA